MCDSRWRLWLTPTRRAPRESDRHLLPPHPRGQVPALADVERDPGAVAVFLGVVVIAQTLAGTSGAEEQVTETAEGTEKAGNSEGAQQPGGDLDFVRRDADDPKAIGSVDAPVVMTEWIDLRCPFCASFSRDTLPALIADYVDTGKVRIEFVDVAFFGTQSEDAQVAVSYPPHAWVAIHERGYVRRRAPSPRAV